MNESHFEMGDEYDDDSHDSTDCSDEFEQGLEDDALLTQARARMDAYFLSKVTND